MIISGILWSYSIFLANYTWSLYHYYKILADVPVTAIIMIIMRMMLMMCGSDPRVTSTHHEPSRESEILLGELLQFWKLEKRFCIQMHYSIRSCPNFTPKWMEIIDSELHTETCFEEAWEVGLAPGPRVCMARSRGLPGQQLMKVCQ